MRSRLLCVIYMHWILYMHHWLSGSYRFQTRIENEVEESLRRMSEKARTKKFDINRFHVNTLHFIQRNFSATNILNIYLSKWTALMIRAKIISLALWNKSERKKWLFCLFHQIYRDEMIMKSLLTSVSVSQCVKEASASASIASSGQFTVWVWALPKNTAPKNSNKNQRNFMVNETID